MTQKAQDSEEKNHKSQPLNEKDACAAVSDYFTSKFEYLPPSFGELFQSSPDMQPFLKATLNLIHLSKDGPLSTESIENIELAIRQLVFSQSYLNNMIENQNSENSAPNSPSRSTLPNSDQVDQIELSRLRSSFLKLKSNYALLQEESNGYKSKISSLQNQIDILNEEKKAVKKSLLQQKKESNNEMSQMKEKDSELSEKYQDALTKIKLMNGVVDGLKTQLKMAQDDVDESLKQNEKLEAKLAEKKKTIYKLKVDLKKQNILFEQASPSANKNSNDATVDSPTTNRKIDNSNNEVIKLKAQLDSKNRDLADSKQIIKDREATIDAHKKRIDSQSDTILNNNKEILDLQKQAQQLKDIIQENENKMNEKDELLNCRANELMNLRDLLMKISSTLSNDYNVEKLTDIPDIIEDLLSIQNDQIDQKLNAKSISFIDALTRFIDTILMNNKTNFNLLIDPPPILGDRELLTQITSNINKLRETFEENYGSSPEENRMFESLLSAKEHFSEDTNNCEFASLIIICAANEKLRRLCIQQKKQIDEYQRLIPYEKYNDFRKLLNSYEKINTQIFKDKFDDRLTLLSTFLDRIITFYHKMKIEVMPALSFDCDLAELPDKLIDQFNELSQSYSSKIQEMSKENEARNSKSKTDDSYTTSDTTDRSIPLTRDETFQSSLNLAETKINKLETQNKKLEDLVRKLLKKVQTLSAEKDSFKDKFNDIVANQNTQEDNVSTINERFLEVEEQERKTRLENERLQALIEQRQQSFQARLDTLLQAERDNSAKELARNEKMWQEEKKSLLSKLESKTAKYNYQRKADRELIEFLEKQIRNQNNPDSKSNSIDSLNSSNGNIDNNDFLNSVIKELQKVVHVKGEWNQQKALSGVKKIVAVISKSEKEPKQQSK